MEVEGLHKTPSSSRLYHANALSLSPSSVMKFVVRPSAQFHLPYPLMLLVHSFLALDSKLSKPLCEKDLVVPFMGAEGLDKAPLCSRHYNCTFFNASPLPPIHFTL